MEQGNAEFFGSYKIRVVGFNGGAENNLSGICGYALSILWVNLDIKLFQGLKNFDVGGVSAVGTRDQITGEGG